MKALGSYRWLVGLIATVGVVALPATASADSKSHNLKMYKVEKHIDLSGDTDYFTMECDDQDPANAGDIVMDGMWRIDHVDQDNDFGTRLDMLNSIHVLASHANYNDAGQSDWTWRFVKDSPGDAQIKVFITCLGKKTEPDGHQHSWKVYPSGGSTEYTHHNAVFTNGSPSFPATATYEDGFAKCGPGQVLIAAGFDMGGYYDATGGYGRILASGYYDPTLPNHGLRDWYWAYAVEPGTSFQVKHSWRCLDLRSTSANGHTHKIVAKFVPPGYGTFSFKANPDYTEGQVSCGELYKGIIASWYIPLGDGQYHAPNYWWHVFFYGMDPRIKSRSFRFGNDDSSAHDVKLGLLCFNDRTT